MADIMNQSQRAAVTVTLVSLEKSLRQARSWLEEGATEGALFQTSLAVCAERRHAALAKVSAALDMIGQFAGPLNLQPTQEPLEAKIVAAMSLGWANLTDSTSDKLRRYGAVAPELGALLDPALERLAELALDISALLSDAKQNEVCHEQ